MFCLKFGGQMLYYSLIYHILHDNHIEAVMRLEFMKSQQCALSNPSREAKENNVEKRSGAIFMIKF